MNRSHNFQSLLDSIEPLAPEAEAPPFSTQHSALSTSFSAPGTDVPEHLWQIAWKIGWWSVMLLAAAVIGANSKVPERPQFIAQGSLARTCAIDHRENCLVCSYTDAQGRERHKSAHCPALAPSGMMAWPVDRGGER